MDKNKESKENPQDFQNPPQGGQLLDKKAEEYLREGGKIEDMPNAHEEEEEENLNKLLKKEERDNKIDPKQVKPK